MEKITGNELELLKIFWERGESTAREIHEESLKIKKRHYATIKTTLDIMFKKGYLNRRKIGPVYLYSSKEEKKSFVKRFFEDIVENVLNGNVLPIFIHFVKKTKLTKEQKAELRELIDNIDED